MKFDTNKQKGNSGLGVAIGYFMKEGAVTSIPINDTQCYDLVVDIDGKLNKVQVKATGQKDVRGSTVVNAKSSGGTKGIMYERVRDTDIDLFFVTNENQEIWIIPKEFITSGSSITLGRKYDKFRVA